MPASNAWRKPAEPSVKHAAERSHTRDTHTLTSGAGGSPAWECPAAVGENKHHSEEQREHDHKAAELLQRLPEMFGDDVHESLWDSKRKHLEVMRDAL